MADLLAFAPPLCHLRPLRSQCRDLCANMHVYFLHVESKRYLRKKSILDCRINVQYYTLASSGRYAS